MTNHQYLQNLLKSQDLTDKHLDGLRSLREQIEAQLRNGLSKVQRVYYAGSFAKFTMIREEYDLDIVIYWAADCGFTLQAIYEAVGNVLKKNWQVVTRKNVGWQLPFEGGLHIDVVPGRAYDETYRYAKLYRSDSGESLQTSIKIHIDTVRNAGRQDAIRLLKLWKVRNSVPWRKSLALELMTIEALKGSSTTDLEQQLLKVFGHIRDTIERVRLVDPANSNNIVSDELSSSDRIAIKAAAQAALDARLWSHVFREG